jgi:hypothetical protein
MAIGTIAPWALCVAPPTTAGAIVFCAMSAQSLMTFGGTGERLTAHALDTPEWG